MVDTKELREYWLREFRALSDLDAVISDIEFDINGSRRQDPEYVLALLSAYENRRYTRLKALGFSIKEGEQIIWNQLKNQFKGEES